MKSESVTDLIISISKVTNNDEISRKIVRQIARDMGGQQVYIPLENRAFREDFEWEVYEDYRRSDGNVKALAKRHGISTREVYRIINRGNQKRKEELKAKIKGSQPSLFDWG